MSAVFNFTFVPWFRSVAPYIHMHRGKTFVVGIAGEAIAADVLAYGGNARSGTVPGGNVFMVDPNFLSYDSTPIEISRM